MPRLLRADFPLSPQTLRCLVACLTVALFLLTAAPSIAQDYGYRILYSFTGGEDSRNPQAALVIDAAGNLYGTTVGYYWGNASCTEPTNCSTVFKLTPQGSGYVFNTIYRFGGAEDGFIQTGPGGSFSAPLAIGPDGNLYGTSAGGNMSECGPAGCGIVFQLTPNRDGSWTKTIIHYFTPSLGDGNGPVSGRLVFDPAGNLYGTTFYGGYGGIVYQLRHASSGRWTENILYDFRGACANQPIAGVVIDNAGNLYGTAPTNNPGAIYELSPSGGGWTSKILHCFDRIDGFAPTGVILDPQGNLYGGTLGGDISSGAGGSVFKLSQAGGHWLLSQIYGWPGYPEDGGGGPDSPMVSDAAGNLYGTTLRDGNQQYANAFQLSPRSGGGWAYTDLHDFLFTTVPSGLVLDSHGNLYGTLPDGGDYGYGAIFEITP